MSNVHLDSFSGAAAALPPRQRTAAHVLAVLAKNSRVSTWDMSEIPWLRARIYELIERRLIVHDDSEAYPWIRYNLTAEGKAELQRVAGTWQPRGS